MQLIWNTTPGEPVSSMHKVTKVIRFWNNDVLENVEGVAIAIGQVLDNMPSPNPSREREGVFG